jgi:HK97 family phage major capsid protein
MTSTSIREAVEGLYRSFESFKETNDLRLKSLEKKQPVDPLVEEKLIKINDVLDKTSQRLGRLEASAKRPFVSVKEESMSYQNTAFFDYIRKGIENGLEQKSLSSENDSVGGYLIPDQTEQTIQSTLKTLSPLRHLARVTSIAHDTFELLVEKGEADAGWITETGDPKETKTPELMKVKIPVHQLYARPRATQKLLDDAKINVENWLAEKISEKMLSLENAAFINGDGEGKPMGILSYGLVSVGKGEWGKFEQVKTKAAYGIEDADVLLDIVHSLKSAYLDGASWLCSRSALASIRRLKDKTGAYLWQPAMALQSPGTLLGYPVYTCDDLPALEENKATNSVLFGNFSSTYQIVDRSGIHILRDPFSSKPYVEFYTTKRVGGDVINFEALKVLSFTKE